MLRKQTKQRPSLEIEHTALYVLNL